MAATGTMDAFGLLHASLVMIARLLKVDVQTLESINSMLKIAMLRSNNNRMTLELLSSSMHSQVHCSVNFGLCEAS